MNRRETWCLPFIVIHMVHNSTKVFFHQFALASLHKFLDMLLGTTSNMCHLWSIFGRSLHIPLG